MSVADKMTSKVAWILTGDGINCENETAYALAQAGFQTRIWHINDLIAERLTMEQWSARCSLLALPGGFSFGDDLGSGKVLALKMKHALGWSLSEFAQRGGLVIGICNGFQALIKLGVFGEDVSITHNAQGRFYDGWVETRVPAAHGAQSVWLKGIERMRLPIRHGEGRVVFRPEVLSEARAKRITLTYANDVNGSADRCAGMIDASGRIFGLMPHPEAYLRATAAPDWSQKSPDTFAARGEGYELFLNAFNAAHEIPRSWRSQ